MLYDKDFITAIPAREHWDGRPLVTLKANYPWLLDRLTHWYDELLPEGDRDLYARLHDVNDSANFLGAFWELIILRFLRENGHEVDYNKRINDKTPDLFWKRHDLIGDVVSISDPQSARKQQAHLHELLRLVHRETLPFQIFITTFEFRDGVNPNLRPIVTWLQGLAQQANEDLYTHPLVFECDDSRLEVVVRPCSGNGGVKGVGMLNVDADRRKSNIKERLQEKVKYRRPIVVFAGRGLGSWIVNEHSLMQSLYGDERISISRAGVAGWTHTNAALNGVFQNCKGQNGGPANTDISAVVLTTWRVEEENFIVWFRAYHNPYAKRPLPREFLAPMQQFIVTSNASAHFTLGWVDKNEGFVVGERDLPVPIR